MFYIEYFYVFYYYLLTILFKYGYNNCIILLLEVNIKKFILLLFALYSLFFVIGSVVAPLAAHYKFYELSAKLTSLFMFSCHQRPDRTFWLAGYPVALCCRCLGFYSGVFISATVSICEKFKIVLKYFVLIFLFSLADILLNFLLNINTGNYIRFLAGFALGISFVIVVSSLFEIKRRFKNEG